MSDVISLPENQFYNLIKAWMVDINAKIANNWSEGEMKLLSQLDALELLRLLKTGDPSNPPCGACGKPLWDHPKEKDGRLLQFGTACPWSDEPIPPGAP